MSDAEFLQELRQHRSWPWQGNKLQQHARGHGAALEELLGRKIDGAALIELADWIRATPDAVRTGIDRDSDLPEYAFIQRVRGDDTAFRTDARWVQSYGLSIPAGYLHSRSR
jgi:hypothetical protein